MKLTITLENLRILLDKQKYNCKIKADLEWLKSELYKEIEKSDIDENKFHWVRDEIIGADYPEDYETLKKYLTDEN